MSLRYVFKQLTVFSEAHQTNIRNYRVLRTNSIRRGLWRYITIYWRTEGARRAHSLQYIESDFSGSSPSDCCFLSLRRLTISQDLIEMWGPYFLHRILGLGINCFEKSGQCCVSVTVVKISRHLWAYYAPCWEAFEIYCYFFGRCCVLPSIQFHPTSIQNDVLSWYRYAKIPAIYMVCCVKRILLLW